MGLVVLATLVVAPATRAQYFGKNKVQYRHLDFAVIATDHFDVYFYEGERAAAVDAARMAERAYARISRVFNHRYRERQPIILFASHSEFQQNNITDIGEGIGGVTEPFRHRILLPFTGSYAEFEHVLQHEIVHQFQFDVFARGRIGGSIPRLMAVNPPLWFTEGMAEYLSLGPITPQQRCGCGTPLWKGAFPPSRSSRTTPGIPPTDSATPSGPTSGSAGATRQSASSYRQRQHPAWTKAFAASSESPWRISSTSGTMRSNARTCPRSR
jgi:hypothetical protein